MRLWKKTTFDVYFVHCLGQYSLVIWWMKYPYSICLYKEKIKPSFHWLAIEYLKNSGIHWRDPEYKRIQGLIKGFARSVKDVEYSDYKTM